MIRRKRFELICKFLHFIDNESLPTFQGPPKLFKIYPVICHLNKKLQTLYLPNQNIAIDEILTPWKGRLSFRQYLPLKASKFGIKTFEMCESTTGYLWCFLVYTGQNTVLESSLITPETPKTAAQLLHMYVVERKRMTKWYLKLFKRLLNSTVLNSIVVYRQVTGRNIEQLSYRIQLVEGLFTKYARAAGEQCTGATRV